MARAEPPQRSRILAGAGLAAGELRPVILVAVLIVAVSCLPYLEETYRNQMVTIYRVSTD